MKRKGLTAAPYRMNNMPRKVNTLYGTETANVRRCKCCGKLKPVTEFYQHGEGKLPSSKDKKYTLRSQCVECYDQYKGKYPEKEPMLTNSLEEFLDG